MSYNIGSRIRLLTDEMKLCVIERYDGRSLDEHFPKKSTLKIKIICPDCGEVFDSNSYQFINKFPDHICNSCSQKSRWKIDYDRLCDIRTTDDYRSNMSVSIKNSKKCKDARKENGKKHVKYWDSIRGFTKEELWGEWKIYRRTVYNMTEKVYRKHIGEINPDGLPRSKYNLDHIYSVQEGFRQNIPPYIISNINNLRMLDRKQNIIKRDRCDITKEQLMNKIFNSEDVYIADICYGT